MPYKIQDLSDFAEQNTLVIKVPIYVDGVPTGETENWTVPPVNLETEIALRSIQDAQLKDLTSSLKVAAGQEDSEGEEEEEELPPQEDPRVMADFWGPVVSLYVKSPKLDSETLKQNYPGALLRKVGEIAQHFFLFGTLEVDETPIQMQIPPKSPRKKR